MGLTLSQGTAEDSENPEFNSRFARLTPALGRSGGMRRSTGVDARRVVG